MSIANLLLNDHSTLFYIAVAIIPLLLIIIGGILLLKRFDNKITDIYGGRKLEITNKNVNKSFSETSSQETHIKAIKENINQTIKQRNLVSRIKMEVQSFEEMMISGHRFNDNDYTILHGLSLDLDHQIEILNTYLNRNNTENTEFSSQIIDQKRNILLQIQQSVSNVIESAKSLDLEKYIESIGKIEFSYQALAKLYQILTIHIQEQLTGDKND